MTESFAEMFEQSLAHQELRRGAVITGTVIDIQPDVVVINAGLKSEGVIPIEQFRNASGELEVTLGDEVEVSLEAIEDGFGETRLSREKAKRDQVWRRLEKAFENEDIVKGLISDKVSEISFTFNRLPIQIKCIHIAWRWFDMMKVVHSATDGIKCMVKTVFVR